MDSEQEMNATVMVAKPRMSAAELARQRAQKLANRAERRGRPRKWLVWRCDKRPFLRVFVPAWENDPALRDWPYAEFLGGRLDTRRLAEYRGLTQEQVEQLNEILAKTKFVYLETQIPNMEYPCEFCEFVANTPESLKKHYATVHAEELDVVAE